MKYGRYEVRDRLAEASDRVKGIYEQVTNCDIEEIKDLLVIIGELTVKKLSAQDGKNA